MNTDPSTLPSYATKWYRPKEAEEVARIHRRTIQKDLNDPDNHDGVINLLNPDILE